MDKILYLCPCARDGEYNPKHKWSRLIDELCEFINEPSRDEASDVIMMASCFIHSFIPAWKWVLPGGSSSRNKGILRFEQHGCMRSKRNRVEH